MARLIPSFFDDETPPGEAEVFNLLSNGYEDWVVFHSLDIAPWNNNRRTEIDFVAIIPSTGIICIEVKSHLNIKFDGDWHPRGIKRSPFTQALDASASFHRSLSKEVPFFRAIPVVHCCIFPRARFKIPANLSVEPWRLIDSSKFRSYKTGIQLCDDLESIAKISIENDPDLKYLTRQITRSDLEKIIEVSLPIQKTNLNRREEIERREEEIGKILRQHQKPVIQMAKMNERLVVSGGAGTGKTIIAKELALMNAISGKRVAFVCYNKLVGAWIEEQIQKEENAPPNLVAGSAMKIMMKMAEIEINEEKTDNFFWEGIVNQIEEKLTDPEFIAISEFDCLIVDEAQDFLSRKNIWDLLCSFLDGGKEKGNFVLFGDFENQVLSSRSILDDSLNELDLLSKPFKYQLTENCRNYQIIGNTAVKLAGLRETVYDGFLRKGGSINNYEIYYYKSEEDQIERLSLWIKKFKNEGYRPSEITLLSFCGDISSAASKLIKKGHDLSPAWKNSKETSFSSVHAFKGMENKIIIFTDVILQEKEFDRNLLYTAITRATESVYILCNENSMNTILNWTRS